MRKAIIAAIVATALFAVGAFAAEFTVNAEDVASGADSVDACAAEVDLDFVTVYDDVTLTTDTTGTVTARGDWDVTGVDVTFYDETGGTTSACDGYGVNVAIMTDSGVPAATGTATASGTGAEVTNLVLAGSDLKVADITSAAVLVDGEELQTPTPGEGFPSE